MAALKEWLAPRVAPLAELRSTGGRAFAALFVLTHALLTIDSLAVVRSPLAGTAQLALAAVGAVLFVGPRPSWSARRFSLTIMGLCCAVTTIGCLNLGDTVTAAATWHWGAASFLLVGLAVQGRLGAVWVGFAAVTAITLAWAVAIEAGILTGVGFVVRHAAMLLVITFFALAVTRSRRRTDALRDAGLRRARDEAASRAALDEQRRRLQRLRDDALPDLHRIASGRELDDDDRRRTAVLEAELRDGVRGLELLTPEVRSAVRAARWRGVVVTLLDDRGGAPLPTADRARVEAALVAALVAAESGHLTARLPPSGREDLLTVVADDGVSIERSSVRAS